MHGQRQRIEAGPYQFLEFRYDELGIPVDDLRGLPWARAKVAQIRSGRLGVRLEFGPYVGRLDIPPRYVIDLRELVPGTIAALAPLAVGGRKWVEAEVGTGSITIDPWIMLARAFVGRLSAYVAAGIRPLYLPFEFDSDHPRGNINIARSAARYWARGQLSRVSTDVRLLTDDTALNRLVLSAAVRAEHLLGSEPTSLLPLRTALRALTGVVLEQAPDVRAAQAIVEPEFADMVELATLILSGVSALPEDLESDRQIVNVWFNAALIFEAGIRALVADSCPEGTVRNGRGDGVTLFVSEHRGDSDRVGSQADPDIVVATPTAPAILDTKYRAGGVEVGRQEVYQLMAHALAYRASHAALVVPRIRLDDKTRHLGVDARGCRYDVVVVDANDAVKAQAELALWLEPLLDPSAASTDQMIPAPG